MSINKLITTGRLTADPVISQVGGVDCASFTLASDTRVRDNEGGYLTNFYRCSAWRKLSEICANYLHKGDKITVVGDLSMRNYKDKNGNERLAVQLSIVDLELPPKAQSASTDTQTNPSANVSPAQPIRQTQMEPQIQAQAQAQAMPQDDDLPF